MNIIKKLMNIITVKNTDNFMEIVLVIETLVQYPFFKFRKLQKIFGLSPTFPKKWKIFWNLPKFFR